MPTLNLTVVACEVFRREFEGIAAQLPHHYTFDFQPFGLHDTPEKLAAHLQTVVDECTDTEAILIGYGLCSRGIVGLRAVHAPLVVPKAHDCMTFFLGSRERYMTEFAANPGTYYYSAGWIERYNPDTTQSQYVPNTALQESARARKYAQYVEQYGEDNAQYLMELETQWQGHYSRTAFIDTGFGNKSYYQSFVQNLARSNGWTYAELEGDHALMRRLLNGEWNEDFLIVPPGDAIRDTADDEIIALSSLGDMTRQNGDHDR
ncbi:DUF1638 domain-containing protein [Candidatus Poribacteria bacterium]|nr:DUF1638 domain-containing protein [Candidatus Poribacteria bacterium]